MKKNITLFTIILFCYACNQKSDTIAIQSADSIFNVNIENCLENRKSIKLSELADSIEYIELRTPPSIVISVAQIEASRDYCFVTSKGILYQFSKKGEFIRQVGSRGQGPEEYIAAGSILIDEEKSRVGVLCYPNIKYYSFDGYFINSVSIGNFAHIVIKDTINYASIDTKGLEKYRLTILNQNFDTLGGISNYDNYHSNSNVMVSTRFGNPFYKYKDHLYFKGYLDNDTIWRLNGSDFEVYATIDMGRYKSTIERDIQILMQRFIKKKGDYYGVNLVNEDDNYLYITLIPYWNPEMLFPCIVFDKGKNTGMVAKDESNHFGIQDDILGGPNFWPKIITEDYYIGVVDAEKILTEIDSNTDIKLKDQLKDINEESNTLLVLARRKK